ncbi:xylulokinase [Povalibacter uvarum]|uniref:Xylulose kinase n=1 Tax=Povalibacter uvarum TaxID=732238 RepID=A0A841HKD5_9GAMM|nr:xylulokinase [Povalibacter uvarum]MBB6093507.1 xylulokinase [Povalibacter uvarum]
MSIVLGIDLGTQGLKVAAYDLERRSMVEQSSSALELISRDDGSREQLASWWVDALRSCVAALSSDVRRRVRAIGVSGQQHGFVPVGRDGDVLGPVKLWCDTSTIVECEEITAAAGGERRCIELTGNPVLPGYTASKVRWMARADAAAYARLTTILLPHDYINFHLTGERFMECGDASGTGWFDVRQRRWNPQMLAAIDSRRDLSACLPPLLGSGSVVPISGAVADRLDLPRSAVVSVGGGDNMMAAIGTRNVKEGRLTVSLGTSGTLFAYASRPVVDAQGRVAAFCSSTDGWLPLICTMNCTVATEQIRRIANIALPDTDRLLERTSVGAEGIVTLPFYNGERTPNLPKAKAAVLGLDMRNATPANLLRSAMEGATFALRHGRDVFSELDLKFDTVCVTGGGAASRVWRQMVADVFGIPVVGLRYQESAALGAALQAAHAYQQSRGGNQSLADLIDEHVAIDPAQCCEPDPENVRRYTGIYGSYQNHLDRLRPYYIQLERGA